MPPVGFQPRVSAGKRPQTYALDRAATGIGSKWHYGDKIKGEMGMAWHGMQQARESQEMDKEFWSQTWRGKINWKT